MLFLVNILGIGFGASLIAALTDFVFADDAALRYSLALASALIAPTIVVILWLGLPHYRRCAEQVHAMQRESHSHTTSQGDQGVDYAQTT